MWRVNFLVLLGATAVLSGQELQQVHIVFSHKFYAPVETTNGTIFPGLLDFRHFLEQTFDMNNKAKLDLYSLGVVIRQIYDSFLGDIYHPDFMSMRTSEYALSMISGQLVNAGLWPPAPEQKWKEDLDWQPVPTDFVPADEDTLLMGYFCPTFKAEEQKVNGNFSSIVEEHKSLFEFLTIHYGKKIETPWDVAMLYSCLETIAAQNVSLPAWANHIFPQGEMKNVSLKAYETLSKTRLQRTLNGGSLLKKILRDAVAHEDAQGNSKLKLVLYSGEDRTVMGLLENLGAWTPHIVKQGASIIFEVYRESNSLDYSIQMFYLPEPRSKVDPIRLNNCGEYCPLTKFSSILEDILPVDEKSICQHIPSSDDPKESPGHDKSDSRLFLISLPVLLLGLSFTRIG
ncbi:venom acid phosphatase Acph-1 [Fopius arisanus]|uniref:acid phosphatase n=2 Tax=Fopius arisanus TaxID=64838 RepID=A0A9R1T5Z6_9HYME|nr:PREDICTED: venom acid phosphatase Acph-1-like [Fopius arisanus]